MHEPAARMVELPFRLILQNWMDAQLEPAACRAALERRIASGEVPRALFDPEQISRGGVVGTDDLLCRNQADLEIWRWRIFATDGIHEFELVRDAVITAGDAIRAVTRAGSWPEALAALGNLGVEDEELLAVLGRAVVAGTPHGRWPAPADPGIYRREHASLLVHTETTSIVTDPQTLSRAWTTAGGQYPADLGPARARIMLTHSHADHFDLASMLRWADPDEPVVIPPIPAPSLLCQNVAGALEITGQAHVAPAWFSELAIDDVAIQVLPFCGEQPTRALPLPGALRNWGSCYRFQLDDFSLAILVDSGADSAGTMVEALGRSVAEKGPIDVLMSCCLEFPEAINPGLPMYAFTVPFEELRRRWPKRASMTSGPGGLAEVCAVSGARWFLPYAHGFSGLGRDPVSEEGRLSESAAVAAVRAALVSRGVGTQVIEWLPGDALRWRDGAPRVVSVRR